MSRFRGGPALTLATVVCMSVLMMGQERDRSKIADKYKWNLADIYPSEAAWRAAKEKTTGEIPRLREFRGKLGSSASTLADALDTMYRLPKEVSRPYHHPRLLSDEDTKRNNT